MDKTESLRVRLTQEEANAFLKVATSLGIKRSRLLRKMIREFINQEPDIIEHEQNNFREIIRLLTSISMLIKQASVYNIDSKPCCLECCRNLTNMKEYFDIFKALCEASIYNTKQRIVRKL